MNRPGKRLGRFREALIDGLIGSAVCLLPAALWLYALLSAALKARHR